MALSPLSRFQASLLLALGGRNRDETHQNHTNFSQWGQPWQYLLSEPYQTVLPERFWQNALLQLPAMTFPELVNWLILLALYHHENPLGFRQDLDRWLKFCQDHFPQWNPGDNAQEALLLWQRLLTLILSERFAVHQLPALLKQPEQWWLVTPAPAFSPELRQGLTAIATSLENYASPKTIGQTADPWIHGVATAIYLWGKNPAQPRLIIHQLSMAEQSSSEAIATPLPRKNQANHLDQNPYPGILPPLTLALVGAYNGMEISQQALTTDHRSAVRAKFLPLGQQLWQRWSGHLCVGSGQENSASAVAPPLGMQRRSSLKLVSQQEYAQILPTHGN